MSETETMTTAERIAAIETSGQEIAFDGCHKLYVVENDAERAVFVNHWSLPEFHPWDIDQATEDIYDAAKEA